ncbi:glycosyltransferase family 9 protein [Candidatus Woesearchaeota archaeon]|nr:glycosyltransferase family 9 protein [Candidatus Woesearchaeota archaeon]
MTNVKLIRAIDRTLGTLLCLILSVFIRKKALAHPKNILFIQLWSIGETILTLPAIAAVKKKYKEAKISVLSTDRNKEVFEAADLDIKIITTKLNLFSLIKLILTKRFDLVIDLEEYLNISSVLAFFLGKYRIGFSHKIRSKLYHQSVPYNDKQHVVKTFLDVVKTIGASDSNRRISLKCDRPEKDLIRNILKTVPKSHKLIGIAPGAAESARSRMWPEERYADLANRLIKEQKCTLVFLGSDNEKTLVREIVEKIKIKGKVIDTTGRLSVKELFCLVDNLDLLISNDTGPVHVASAQGTKVIGLYGPNTPIRFGPFNPNSIAIYKPESCQFSPCINVHKGQVPNCLYKKDSKEYQKCMKAIGINEVLDAVKQV